MVGMVRQICVVKDLHYGLLVKFMVDCFESDLFHLIQRFVLVHVSGKRVNVRMLDQLRLAIGK